MIVLSERENLEHEVSILRDESRSFSVSDRNVLLYSLSVGGVFLFLIYRLLARRCIWLRHEVTTFQEKRVNNGIFYSTVMIFLDQFLRVIASEVVCANPALAGKQGYTYFPLPYSMRKKALSVDNSQRDIDVLFFGRSDHTKSESLWRLLEADKSLTCVRAGGEHYVTDAAKYALMERSKFILNRYLRPFGQSGVTPDGLSCGCVVLTSEYDSLLTEVGTMGGFLVSLPSANSDQDCHKYIVELVKAYPDTGLDHIRLESDFEFKWGTAERENAYERWAAQ